MTFGTADARHKTPGIGPLKRANGAAVAATSCKRYSASAPPGKLAIVTSKRKGSEWGQ